MSILNFVICPVRNGLHLTRNALPTFLNQDIGDIRVLFIDNASEDGTSEWLRSLDDPRVWVCRQNPPMSVAKSWNFGLKYALLMEDYALVVNNDVELPPHFYRLMVKNKGPFVTGIGVDLRGWMEAKPKPKDAAPHPDFSAFLIRNGCWDMVGKFDENFTGAYGEDCDYHVRMHKAGICAVSIGVPFYHVASGTIKNATRDVAKQIGSDADRNREYFRQKHGFAIGSPEYDRFFTE